MGSYDRRNKEIDEALTRFINTEYKKKLEEEKRGGDPVIHATYVKYSAGLQSYHGIRTKALEKALGMTKGVSESTKGAQHQEEWKKIFSAAAKESYDTLTSTFKDRDFDDFKTYVELVALADSDFYNKMGAIPLIEAQGKVMEYLVQLKEEQENLKKKWQQFASDSASLQSKVNSVTEQLMKVFKDALREVQEENKVAGEKLADWAKKGKVATGLPNPFVEILKLLVKSADKYTLQPKDYIKRLEDLYRTNETTVIMFAQTRKSVKEFLEKTNLEIAIKTVEDAYRKSQDLAGSCYTSALKDDAKYFVDDVYREVKASLDKFKDIYEDFVGENKGIFLGPVGDKTVQDLVNKQRWDWVKNEWASINIESELKKIYDDSQDYWDVSLDGVPDMLEEELKKTIKGDLEALSLAVREATDWTHADAVKYILTGRKPEKLMEILKD